MKIINMNQIVTVSGGCQKAIDKYELSANFYEEIGTLTGFAVGMTLPGFSTPAKILAAVAGAYVGAELGYVFGATSYWLDRGIHKTTDGFLKPSL